MMWYAVNVFPNNTEVFFIEMFELTTNSANLNSKQTKFTQNIQTELGTGEDLPY